MDNYRQTVHWWTCVSKVFGLFIDDVLRVESWHGFVLQ